MKGMRNGGREGGRAYLTKGGRFRVGQEDFDGHHDGTEGLVQGLEEVDHA